MLTAYGKPHNYHYTKTRLEWTVYLCQKNDIFVFTKVSTIFMITGNTDTKDHSHLFHGSFAMMFFENEQMALMNFYFFQRYVKKQVPHTESR